MSSEKVKDPFCHASDGRISANDKHKNKEDYLKYILTIIL